MESLFEKLPKEFISKLKYQLSESDFYKFEDSINNKPIRGLRVNKKRIDISQYLQNCNLELKRLNFCDDGFVLIDDTKLGNNPDHLSGVIYLQEPASMLAVCASEIEKENKPLKVLDLCASPGGKSSQIASRISSDSMLFSNEIIKQRAQVLFSNIERQGFDNVVVLNEDPQNLTNFQGYFDYVFVDAPCSGEGMFRKNPETIEEWSEEIVLMCANRQKEILELAINLVAKNGKLVYSTCTYSPEEDENIVEWLSNEKGFELMDVDNEIKIVSMSSNANVKNADYARKCYTFKSPGEGQFISVFRNKNENQLAFLKNKKHYVSIKDVEKSDFSYIKEFFEKSLNFKLDRKLLKVGDSIYFPPQKFEDLERAILDELKFLSIGVKLGNVEKGRFEPHHSLFMALDKFFKVKIELSDENLRKYLHGEELMIDITPQKSSIYVVLTKNGQPIGGGKLVGNRIKNLYPKGMRV